VFAKPLDRESLSTRAADRAGRTAHSVGDQRKASADIGLLEYATSPSSVDRERAIQWLILAMVLT
jgi:hypothetical protein